MLEPSGKPWIGILFLTNSIERFLSHKKTTDQLEKKKPTAISLHEIYRKTTQMISLDVIYVNYNSTDCLIRSIENIISYKYENRLNIIVVDNSSNDTSYRLKLFFHKIYYIQNEKNVGFGAAINQALTYCHSKYIILLNPDSFIFDGFFDASVSFMERNEQVGVMGPMIVDKDGSIQGSARAFPTPLTSLFGRNSPITKMFPNNSITKSNILAWGDDIQTPMEVDWVSGACMVVRREAMQAVEG